MKRNIFGFTKRILAMALCLAMLLAFLPAQAAKAAEVTEGKTYTVVAGSDFQYSNSDHGIAGGHVRNILGVIKNQGFESFDGLLFCGDYSQAFTTDASKEGVTYLKNVISEELPSISDDNKFFLQGNHDMDVETTDGTLTPSGGHETEGYSVYAINEKDYAWDDETNDVVKNTAANLRSFLNAKSREGYTKPIFILSHMQLHYSMRTYESGDGAYANFLFDVINEAAGNGLNIFFLFGHNHSNGWDDYLGGSACYLNKGDSILIAQNSNTEFRQETLNFTYMNAGYVGYYTRVNDGADNTLTMSLFQITDDQVTIYRYSDSGLHDLKSVGVTNAYRNETAYGPDTRVLPSPQVVKLNKDINTTAVSGASVSGEGITSFEVLAGASQLPQGFSFYQSYQISAEGYIDGNEVTVTLPLDSNLDSNRPVLVLDHARGKSVPLFASGGSISYTTDHLGCLTVAQTNGKAVTSSNTVPKYFRTVPQGEYIQTGVPYVIADSGLDKTSHWVLTGTALKKTVGSATHTGLALEEVANADTSPVWYYDGTNVHFGAPDGPCLNISYTGDYNGDASVGLVTLGDYNAATSAKVSHFGSGPSYNLSAGAADTTLYLAHRNSGADSIASVYAKYNYNVTLWYFNEVISTAKLSVAASQNTITMKDSALLLPTVTAGTGITTDYTITWESGDPSIATVSSEGIVSPVKAGQVYIKATLTTLAGNAVEGISVELPITVVSSTVSDSTAYAWTQFLHQQGAQEVPVAGQTYLVAFYSGGWYLTGNILHQEDEGYKGLNGVEGLEVALNASVPEDVWYYDGTNLYSGLQADPNKCLIYENNMVTVGPVTENNQAFVVDKSVYEYWPYVSVDAGKLNHYGGVGYNVASLFNGNNFMKFFKVVPDQKINLTVTPVKSTLYTGQTVSLTPTVKVDNTQTNTYTILWTSSDLCVATVDGQGNVRAVDGGEAIITASLVSINGGEMSQVLSVEIPIRVVQEQETADSVTAMVTMDRSLKRTTTLENGKPYVISSTLRNNWVLTGRFKTSDCDASYTGVVLEHFTLSESDNVWYYIEETVDGVAKQYLRYSALSLEDNYLRCLNRTAALGQLGSYGFDSIALNETHGAFKILYTASTRHLHQLGGRTFDTAIPTTQYANDTGSFWYFNTVVPGGAVKLTLNKPTADFHMGQESNLFYGLTLDGIAVTDYKANWTCADTGIATVSNGKVTGIAPGSTTVTASVTEVNGKTLDTALAVSVSVTVEDHSWTDATCTVPKTCVICGTAEGASVGHSYEAVVTAPSCTEAGYTTYTCHCGDTYTADKVAALGHKYNAVITTAPGCESAGVKTFTCENCGDVYTEPLAATGHNYEAVVTAPSCTEAGYTTYTCHCGDTYTANEVAALGHKYNAVITTAPGCESAGVKTFTCENCGDVYTEPLAATGHNYTSKVTAPTCTEAGYTTYSCPCGHSYVTDEVAALGHSYKTVTVNATCTEDGSITNTCPVCGDTKVETIPATGHSHEAVVTAPTCTETGYTTYTCHCGDTYTVDQIAALGHSFENGTCGVCGEVDPDYVKPVVKPTLTLKAPTLEFKDMITVNAMFTAENIDDVVEMGMITYREKVDEWSVETAAFVIPGTAYDSNTGRYIATSQGIHAKYLGDTVYLACYAKLTDGSYVYTKLASYSPVQYAASKLNGTDVKLKQLVVAMLNYGAAAQTHFNHNVENLANATLTAEQIALPEAYRSDMVGTVPAAAEAKQGSFLNNKGFAKRYPAISFEGAFCINYFFKPNYTPVDGITLYYWNEADFNAAEVLTARNASGSMELVIETSGEYRGDIVGIAAKNLSGAVYVAAVYSDGTTTWTSGVLGYSIGAYCASQSTKGGTIADLAMATAVYGYQAKQYFG